MARWDDIGLVRTQWKASNIDRQGEEEKMERGNEIRCKQVVGEQICNTHRRNHQ